MQPVSTVEDKGFVNVAEPHYKVPSRTYFATNIHPFMMTYKEDSRRATTYQLLFSHF